MATDHTFKFEAVFIFKVEIFIRDSRKSKAATNNVKKNVLSHSSAPVSQDIVTLSQQEQFHETEAAKWNSSKDQ